MRNGPNPLFKPLWYSYPMDGMAGQGDVCGGRLTQPTVNIVD
jgi:hypothetical protein